MLTTTSFKLFNCPVLKLQNQFNFEFGEEDNLNISIKYILNSNPTLPKVAYKIRLSSTKNLVIRKISDHVSEFTLRFFVSLNGVNKERTLLKTIPIVRFQESSIPDNRDLKPHLLNTYNSTVSTIVQFQMQNLQKIEIEESHQTASSIENFQVDFPSFVLFMESPWIGLLKSVHDLTRSRDLSSLNHHHQLLEVYLSESVLEMSAAINRSKLKCNPNIFNAVAHKYGYEFIFHDGFNQNLTNVKKTVRFCSGHTTIDVESFKEIYKRDGLFFSQQEVIRAKREAQLEPTSKEFFVEEKEPTQTESPKKRDSLIDSPIGRWVIVPMPRPLLYTNGHVHPSLDHYPSHELNRRDFNFFKAEIIYIFTQFFQEKISHV